MIYCIYSVFREYMKNPKNIFVLVFLFMCSLLQAHANPVEKECNMRLKDKVALVTGAASGNGKAIASLFAKEGARVVIADINAEGANALAKELSGRGLEAVAVQADVTKEGDVRKMFDATLSKYGRLDILVNNAGVFDELIPVGNVSDELWDRVIATNLTAPMRAIRMAVPIFERQGGGVIVNTASIAGYTGARGGGAAYVASKHGLVGLTKNVAYNYKERNIRCNAVAPGRVETNLRVNSEKLVGSKTAHDATIGKWKEIENKIIAGHDTNLRKCVPAEIAAAVLFLASDEASFVNGSILTVDGAWTCY